jgi:hypothetical protein
MKNIQSSNEKQENQSRKNIRVTDILLKNCDKNQNKLLKIYENDRIDFNTDNKKKNINRNTIKNIE